MRRCKQFAFILLSMSMVALSGCEGLVKDTTSLLAPRFMRSEVLGLVAGFGTTFAAVPDMITMLRRRSSKGMNPTMAAIMGVFQILWVWYGLLIASRPVVLWNLIAVVTNFFCVAAFPTSPGLNAKRPKADDQEKRRGFFAYPREAFDQPNFG